MRGQGREQFDLRCWLVVSPQGGAKPSLVLSRDLAAGAASPFGLATERGDSAARSRGRDRRFGREDSIERHIDGTQTPDLPTGTCNRTLTRAIGENHALLGTADLALRRDRDPPHHVRRRGHIPRLGGQWALPARDSP